MENKNYKVILLSTPDANDELAGKLASLFKITPDKAQAMLAREEFVIKKQTDRATAEKFHQAITAAGARCKVEEVIDEVEIDLPSIDENIETPKETAPLIDPTSPAPELVQSKPHQKLSLQSITRESDDLNANVDPDCFCPECGTIRETADSVCNHCGYDPVEESQQNRKSILLRLGLGIIAVVLIIAVAYPFYLKFSKRMQIEDDLKLAFDARNQVTEFIQRTNFWPNQNIDAGLDKDISNRSIESVIVGDDAVITVTLRGTALDGESQTIIFTPNILKGRIVWSCLKGSLSQDYRPEICRVKEP